MTVEQRVAIITGASSGIGAATAQRLAKEGFRVALAARRNEALALIAVGITAFGGEALAVPTDVRQREELGALVQHTLAAWGRVDVLVNNAGLGYAGPLVTLAADQLREQVATNLLAVIEASQAVLPTMIAQQRGHIINVASIAGLIGLPHSTVYSATKAGVIGFSEGLGREVRRYGIHVTALCPGFVATDFSPRLREIRQGRTNRRLPGVMSADYVAGVIADIIRRPRRRVIIPRGWAALVWLGQTLPGLTDRVLSKFLG